MVTADLRSLFRENRFLARAREPLITQTVRGFLSRFRLSTLLGIYLLCDIGLALIEALAPSAVLAPNGATVGFVKDVASYFITLQVALLGVISVAIGIVTLLSQRSDGSAARTDTKLYYFESFAIETVKSSIALLIVLVVQLFWPLQAMVRAVRPEADGTFYAAALTVAHAIWLCVNLGLEFRFLLITLTFLDARARERLRENYCASVVIPNTIFQHLSDFHFQRAAAQAGLQDSSGPLVYFGQASFETEGRTEEIKRLFARTSTLHDVRLAPLITAVRSWRDRTKSASQTDTNDFGRRTAPGALSFPINFGMELDGERRICIRDGGLSLSRYERALIGFALKFRPVNDDRADLPTPVEFVEGLADQIESQIIRGAKTAFDRTFDELTRFHKFLIQAQQANNSRLGSVNYAELGQLFNRQDQAILNAYRKIFDAAANAIPTEEHYTHALSYVVQRLVPQDPASYSPAVVSGLQRLAVYNVIAVANWFDRSAQVDRTSSSPALILGARDGKAYLTTLKNVVSGWENILTLLPYMFGQTAIGTLPASDRWQKITAATSFLFEHLTNAAYFLATAVVHGDATGADLYRDLLVRWADRFTQDLGEIYSFHHIGYLAPAVLDLGWDEAEAQFTKFRRIPITAVTPKFAFALTMYNQLSDTIVATAAICLNWYLGNVENAELAGQTAQATLEQRAVASEGDRLSNPASAPRQPFEITFELLIKGTRSGVEHRVRAISSAASVRRVSGRLFGGWGGDGVDSLERELLIFLCAYFTQENAARALASLDWLSNDDNFGLLDGPMADMRFRLRVLKQRVESLDAPTLEKGVHLVSLSADSEKARADLLEFLKNCDEMLERRWQTLLASSPIDPSKIKAIQVAVEDHLLKDGPTIPILSDFTIIRGAKSDEPPISTTYREFSKEYFLHQELTGRDSSAIPKLFTDLLAANLASPITGDLARRPTTRKTIKPDALSKDFWDEVFAAASLVGDTPLLLVGNEIGQSLLTWVSLPEHAPEWFSAIYDHSLPSGNWYGYAATVKGVIVYQVNWLTDAAYMFSRHALKELIYHRLGDGDEIALIDFVPEVDLTRSGISLTYKPSYVWDNSPQFQFMAQPSGPPQSPTPEPTLPTGVPSAKRRTHQSKQPAAKGSADSRRKK